MYVCPSDTAGPSLTRRVAASLDVVTIGVEHERAVVVFMILGPQTRGPIVPSPRGHGRLVKSIDERPVVGAKCDVQRGLLRRALMNPKIRLLGHPHAEND